jgi:hypothetical protein
MNQNSVKLTKRLSSSMKKCLIYQELKLVQLKIILRLNKDCWNLVVSTTLVNFDHCITVSLHDFISLLPSDPFQVNPKMR